VYFQVGSSAILGTGTDFLGNIIALASITATTGADICGRAIALTAAVTMDTNSISRSCSDDINSAEYFGFSGGGVLDTNAIPLPATLPLFAAALGMLGLLSWRRNRNASKSVA
jgi:type VI secretion system secreted protein VgrG